MKVAFVVIVLVCVAALLALVIWRQLDHRADTAEMNRLRAQQLASPMCFSPAMIADLPDPAQRFFRFTIAEGTPLFTVAEIDMTGRFSLGTREAPNYMAMEARQILAVPHGFVWKMSGGTGAMRVGGSDTGIWTRFWLLGLAPVARVGGDLDHARSAFGRMVGEAVFWTPAALLPGPGIAWEAVSADTARVTVRQGQFEQSVELSVDAEGRPREVRFQRWSNANPDRVFRLQPFGGTLSEFRDFHGFRIPTHVEAGNFFGTDAYFPFFIADVADIRFPVPGIDR